ncbi:MAG: rRNA maturation RNase YbeY [Eubacteriales bacterium]
MTHMILVETEVDFPPELENKIGCAIAMALEEEKVPFACEINVLLTDDQGIQELNKEYRGMDKATDVLSFPMFQLTAGIPPTDPEMLDVDSDLLPLGDMVLSLERVEAQAKEYGHSVQQELCYLAIHSVLHLLGYDHVDEGVMKQQMRTREKHILAEATKEMEEFL